MNHCKAGRVQKSENSKQILDCTLVTTYYTDKNGKEQTYQYQACNWIPVSPDEK